MRIAIIGFKCSGKSTVGKKLALKLEKQFVDLDEIIENLHEESKHENLSFREIYKKYGKDYFRSMESKAVRSACKIKNCVLSLGGGTVAYGKNGNLIENHFTVVYLKESVDNLLKRIKNTGVPAFLERDRLEDSMKEKLNGRRPIYKKYADFELDRSDLSIDETVSKIIEIVKS